MSVKCDWKNVGRELIKTGKMLTVNVLLGVKFL